MRALLKAELIKLRTTRTFVALTAVAVITSLVITALVTLLGEPTQESVLTDVFTTDTSSLFILVLAIVGICGEWRHRTITSAILATPNRLHFLAAKSLAFAAAGLTLSLVISLSVAIFGLVVLSVRDLPTPEAGELLTQIGRNAEVAALLGAFGVGVGGLLRNPLVAIVAVLLISFVLEPAIAGFAPDVGRFGPFTVLPLGVQDIPPDAVGLGDGLEALAPGPATLAMLAWIGAAFAAAAALLRARDLG